METKRLDSCKRCGRTNVDIHSCHPSFEYLCNTEEKYFSLVDFMRSIVNRKIYSLGVSVETAKAAEKILKEIGEI